MRSTFLVSMYTVCYNHMSMLYERIKGMNCTVENSPFMLVTLKMHFHGVIFTCPERCLPLKKVLIHMPYTFFTISLPWRPSLQFCFELSCSRPFKIASLGLPEFWVQWKIPTMLCIIGKLSRHLK